MARDTTDDNSSQIFVQREELLGHQLEGREVLVCWDDGVWYDAVVVCYYADTDEYKMVYRADDGIEIAKLRDRRWILAPKKRSRNNRPILDGALIEFEYPTDGNRYQAMVYDYSHGGERLKIAYIEEHTTDNLKGGGWDFISTSPCIDEGSLEIPRAGTRSRSPLGDPDDADNAGEPLPVNVAAARAAALERASNGISKKRKSPKISKGVRRSSTSSARTSTTRVSSRSSRR